jgi:hypothetical protein
MTTSTISIIELKKEICFLTGYKARKYGKLVFVVLYNTHEKMDDEDEKEKIKNNPKRAAVYEDLKEAEIIAEQNLERIKNSQVVLEDGEILQIKIVLKRLNLVHPSLRKSYNDEMESRRIILLQDEALRSRLTMARDIITENMSILIKNHSNFVGAESCWINGNVSIRLCVTCKHYIPEGESELPEYIGEFRTYVRQSWFQYC